MRGRRIKPDIPMASYHVMTRVVQQEPLLSDAFKTEVVEPWLERYVSVYYVELSSDTTMTNHTHFLIRVYKPEMDLADLERRFNLLQSFNRRPRVWSPDKAEAFYNRMTDLSKFMKDFNWRIATIYNRQNKKKGHFWDDRFKSRVLEGPLQEFYTDIYIQSNPAKAKMVDHPSEYQWCTAGRLKQGIESGEKVEAPALGPFARIHDIDQRNMAYLACHDYFASLIYDPGKKVLLPPAEIIALALTDEDYAVACEELKNRGPVNWSKPGYGSESFEKQIKSERAGPPLGSQL